MIYHHILLVPQVTGSNKGIGFAIVRGLCKQFSGDVYLTCKYKYMLHIGGSTLMGKWKIYFKQIPLKYMLTVLTVLMVLTVLTVLHWHPGGPASIQVVTGPSCVNSFGYIFRLLICTNIGVRIYCELSLLEVKKSKIKNNEYFRTKRIK